MDDKAFQYIPQRATVWVKNAGKPCVPGVLVRSGRKKYRVEVMGYGERKPPLSWLHRERCWRCPVELPKEIEDRLQEVLTKGIRAVTMRSSDRGHGERIKRRRGMAKYAGVAIGLDGNPITDKIVTSEKFIEADTETRHLLYTDGDEKGEGRLFKSTGVYDMKDDGSIDFEAGPYRYWEHGKGQRQSHMTVVRTPEATRKPAAPVEVGAETTKAPKAKKNATTTPETPAEAPEAQTEVTEVQEVAIP